MTGDGIILWEAHRGGGGYELPESTPVGFEYAWMLGGTPEQALDASSIALSNLLGLVCDPVGGLVEVPCQNRNAIGVAAAFSSAQLALAGIKSLVPFDQMAHVMLSVGHALPATLRETAKGGIAQAPAALSACAKCGVCG